MPLISCNGDCPAARAYKSQAESLQALVEKLTDQVASMADPLVHARIAASQRKAEPRPERPPVGDTRSHNASTIRRAVADRPDPSDRPALPSNNEVHDQFES